MTIDAESDAALRRLAEEVRATRAPIVLRLGCEEVALISPVVVDEWEMIGVLTRARYERLMSTAGGWAGVVDTEPLKSEIEEKRTQRLQALDRSSI